MPSPALSLREEWATLDDAELDVVLARYSEAELEALVCSWHYWARPDQLEPVGDWRWRRGSSTCTPTTTPS